MANGTEMVSLTKGYRPYKFREARFWQKGIHSFSQWPFTWGLHAPCWARDRKWLLSPQSSQSSQRERPLNRGRQCPCDTHHMARRMLWNPDERGPWPATGQGRQEGAIQGRQEGAIRSTFFKIKVRHKIRWGMAWGSACPRKKPLLELELEIRMSVCSVENSDNHKSKAENRTEDASPSPAVQIPCASWVAQWTHTTRLLSRRTSYHPELWSQLLPASMRRARHFLST